MKKIRITLLSAFLIISLGVFAQRGTGLTVADYELVPDPLYYQYYGEVLVGEEVTKTITLTNIGTHQAIVSGLFTNSPLYTVNTSLPIYVEAGAQTEISVTFRPEEIQVASYDAQLTIVNAPDMDVQIINIQLSGYGKGALIAVTPKEFVQNPVLKISTSELLNGQFATVTLNNINKGTGRNELSSFEVVLSTGEQEIVMSDWNVLPDSYNDPYTYYEVTIALSDNPSEQLHLTYFEKIGSGYDLKLRLDQNPVIWGANLMWDVQDQSLIGKVATFTVRSLYYGNLVQEFTSYYTMYQGTNYRYMDTNNYPSGYYFVTLSVEGMPVTHTTFYKQ